MLQKETFTLSKEEFFAMGDRTNLEYAIMIRNRLEQTAKARGFARRLLSVEKGGSVEHEDGVELVFDTKTYDRAQEMKDQITIAESNHYVREDRALFDRIRKNIKPKQIVHSTWDSFTPALLASVHSLITRKEVPVAVAAMHGGYWSRFIGNSDFTMLFDPSTRIESVENGLLGTMLGMSIQSDAYAHPALRIFEEGEMFICGVPERFGKMKTYGEDDGILIETNETENRIDWNFPHDFRFEDLNFDHVALLKMHD
ncbi:MAG: hypothetical protein ABWX90_03860 [Candidatus Saccharimonadales bacterium]